MQGIETVAAASPQTSMSHGIAGDSPAAPAVVSPNVKPQRKSETNDFQVIERMKNGDQAALESLFDRYSGKLYGVAHRILGEAADTEEVIQDVFWTVFRKAGTFRGESRLSTWLYRLTVNTALGRMRRSKKKREVEYEDYLPKFQKDGHHLVRPVVDWSDTLEENYAHKEVQSALADALDALKPVDRAVVVLSDMEGLADKEIAATLGLTLSAVKTRLHRARLFLRGKLSAQLGYSVRPRDRVAILQPS